MTTKQTTPTLSPQTEAKLARLESRLKTDYAFLREYSPSEIRRFARETASDIPILLRYAAVKASDPKCAQVVAYRNLTKDERW